MIAPRHKKLFALSTCCLVITLVAGPAFSCTVFLLPLSPGQIVAIDMDWATGQGLVFITKRNVHKKSAFVNPPQTPLEWTSKYLSLTFTQTGQEFPWEGMNEKGLSATVLFLPTTGLPSTSVQMPGVNGVQWVQYILDTSATTAEAVTNAQAITVTGPVFTEEHYFVCDATGACATFEYVYGSLVIHQGASLPYSVLSNSTYNFSYANLTGLLAMQTPAQILALPAHDSLTRFAKGALLSSQYSPQMDEASYGFSALNTVQEPDTQWTILLSLANQTLQYKTKLSPYVKFIDLHQFNPQCSSGAEYFHVNAQMEGDVSSFFSPSTSAANNTLVSENAGLSSAILSTLQNYPSTTQCTETTTTLTSSSNPASSGQSVAFTAQVTGNGSPAPTGTVTWQNGTTALATASLDSNGAAQFVTSNLPAGTSFLTATYGGDSLNASSTSSPLSQGVGVQPVRVSLTSNPNPASVSQSVTLSATVTGRGPGVPTGSVTFQSGATTIGTAVLNSSGVAQLATTALPAGTIPVAAVYSGDARNAASVSSTLSEMVNSQTTQTGLGSSVNPSAASQSVNFTANVSGQNGGVPTGSVTFSVASTGGTTLSPPVGLHNGQAIYAKAFPTAGGRGAVTASYSGDVNNQASTSSTLNQSVNPQSTEVSIISSINPSAAGQPVTFTVNVVGQYGGVPTGTVMFNVNGTAVGPVVMINGQASLTRTFSVLGGQNVAATYSGDSNNQGSSATLNQVVNSQQPTQTSLTASLNPASVGQSVTYTAVTTAQGGRSPTGTITFSLNGRSLAAVPVNNGQATYARTVTYPGTRSVVAEYSGDTNNQPSTSPALSQVVRAQPTQTSLSASPGTASIGQTVTFTAPVTGQNGANSTGTVTFRVNGGSVATVLLVNGQAICSQTFSSSGVFTITSTYSGDGANLASSSTLTEVVN